MSPRSMFPPVAIDDALIIPNTILQHNGGNPMRRVTIFDALGREPESNQSRALITASKGFNLTEGHYRSEVIKLTSLGLAVVSQEDVEAKLRAALSVEAFRLFFDRYKDATIPSQSAALDYLKTIGIPDTTASSCLEVILTTGRQVGLIQMSSGKERVFSQEHALENLRRRSSIVQHEGANSSEIISKAVVTIEQPREAPAAKGVLRAPEAPSLHIDVQIHISADAKSDQIDQVFASMAKHLYNRGD